MKARIAIVPLALLALSACSTMHGDSSTDAYATAPPGGDYQNVSDLTPLPEFIPGLGTLYVQPATLPAGPFLAYDRDGQHVSTIYMIPLAKIEAHAKLTDLQASGAPVEAVSMYYNPGHPGVAEPHYHVVLWHVPPEQADLE